MKKQHLKLVLLLVGLFTVIAGWLYVNTYLYKSKAAGSPNGATIEYAALTQSVPVNQNQTTTLSIKPNVATEQISAVDLTLKATGVMQIVDVVPAPTFTSYDELKRNITATSANISYINRDLAKRPEFLITYKGSAAGQGTITVDTAASQVVGTVSTIAFLLDTINTPPITFGTTQTQDDGINLSFNPAAQSYPENSDQTITLSLTPQNTSYQISALDLVLTSTGSVEFSNIGVPTGYDAASQLIRDVTPQRIRLSYASQTTKPNSQITVTLRAKTAGTGTVAVDTANSQIVGTVPNNAFVIAPVTSGVYTVGTGGVTPPTATPGAGTVTATPSTGTGTPVATLSPVPGTGTPIATPTPIGTVDMKITIKMKFQGLSVDQIKNLIDEITKLIQVTLEGPNKIKAVIKVKLNKKDGTFEGTIKVRAKPGTGTKITIKGKHHLRKSFCKAFANTENTTGKNCKKGEIVLKAGDNVIDASGALLLAGDLTPQDGVVDAFDLSVIRAHLGKKDEQSLAIADVNSDGIVDTQDMSLVVQSLSAKFDDESLYDSNSGQGQGSLIENF